MDTFDLDSLLKQAIKDYQLLVEGLRKELESEKFASSMWYKKYCELQDKAEGATNETV